MNRDSRAPNSRGSHLVTIYHLLRVNHSVSWSISWVAVKFHHETLWNSHLPAFPLCWWKRFWWHQWFPASIHGWGGWMDGWMDHPKRLGAGAFFPHLLSCVCLDRMWLQWVRTLLKIFFEVRKVRKIELESMLHLNGTKALDLVSIM